MLTKRKLLEVSLPLEAINKRMAREKSIRHGHPSTLHLWWARRPLPAARAVLFAQLVDDPSAWPEEFPPEDDQRVERERLHAIIERFGRLGQRSRREVARRGSRRDPQVHQRKPDAHPGSVCRWRHHSFGGAREQAARAAADAASQTAPEAPTVVTTTGRTISPSQPSTSKVYVVALGRYEGRYEVDPSQPDAIAGRLSDVVEEVVRHVAAAQGAENVSIVLEVSADNAEGFSEAVARTVRENSKVLGFDPSVFQDVER